VLSSSSSSHAPCFTYFSLLDLGSPRFALDTSVVRARAHALLRLVHPDVGDARGLRGAHQDLYTSWSSLINRAQQTLKDPLLRAIYLVELYEREESTSTSKSKSKSTSTSTPTPTPTTAPPLFDISQVLEIREQIADCTHLPAPCKHLRLQKLKAENLLRCRETEAAFAQALDGARNLDAARLLIVKLRYWKSIEKALDEVEENEAK